MKLNKVKKQGIVGISALAVGLYMILILKEVRGLVPFTIGVGVLLWRFK